MKAFILTIIICFGAAILSFGQTTKVRGKVVDSDGNPIPNVKVTYNAQSDHSSAPDGLFDIPTLDAFEGEDIYLTVVKNGYYLANSHGKNIYHLSANQRKGFITIKMIKQPLPDGVKRIAVLPFCDDSPNEKPLIDGAFTAKAD